MALYEAKMKRVHVSLSLATMLCCMLLMSSFTVAFSFSSSSQVLTNRRSESIGVNGPSFGDDASFTTYTCPRTTRSHRPSTQLFGFFDDLMKGFDQSGDNDDQKKSKKGAMEQRNDDNEEQELNETDFIQELKRRRELDAENANANQITVSNVMTKQDEEEDDEDKEFDGYALRDAIYNKWGQCFDVDFQPGELGSLYIITLCSYSCKRREKVISYSTFNSLNLCVY